MDLPRPFDPDLERALAPAQRALLDRYGFHLGRFAEGRARLRARTAFALNFARGTLAPPAAAQLPALPPPGSAARRHLAEIGNAAIARGEVAAILLNGGMATRLCGFV
ncbi:MAG: hypothetical protein HZA54_10030 [Planctomycetes bacterium]|nr:hypothetical protein [Planctomycetota bacterium]